MEKIVDRIRYFLGLIGPKICVYERSYYGGLTVGNFHLVPYKATHEAYDELKAYVSVVDGDVMLDVQAFYDGRNDLECDRNERYPLTELDPIFIRSVYKALRDEVLRLLTSEVDTEGELEEFDRLTKKYNEIVENPVGFDPPIKR